MSKRIHVTLPDGIYLKLETWAESEARPVANLAAYLLQKVIEGAEDQGKIPLPKNDKSK
ncbi:ribbon-helix-helix domain-containing protein [Pantanalinema rosaneae CENA516]|uniref:ribbon-helix-helix domain-containing protein n=1 Tax=Pantanalinema rosaneae TaxID=1620701 RepID=UPI003D6E9B30